VLAQRRGADHVEEEDSDLLEHLGRVSGGQRWGQCGELGTQAGDQPVDERITQQGPLGFQGQDAGLELLLHARHVQRG